MVSIVPFDALPSRAADLAGLVRWRVGKTAPFGIEEAQVSYTPGAATGGGRHELVVAVMHRDVVESVRARVRAPPGRMPGWWTCPSFNVDQTPCSPPAPSAAAGDWLLVHAGAGAGYAGHRARRRARAATGTAPRATPAPSRTSMHQTAMYYQDRLGGRGFGRAVLAGEPFLEGGAVKRLRRGARSRKRLGGDLEWLGAVLAARRDGPHRRGPDHARCPGRAVRGSPARRAAKSRRHATG